MSSLCRLSRRRDPALAADVGRLAELGGAFDRHRVPGRYRGPATGVDLRGYKQLRLVVSVGLAGLLWQPKSSLKSKIPFYIGGEECFCSRELTAPPLQGNFGALDRRALEEADVTITFAEGPRRRTRSIIQNVRLLTIPGSRPRVLGIGLIL